MPVLPWKLGSQLAWHAHRQITADPVSDKVEDLRWGCWQGPCACADSRAFVHAYTPAHKYKYTLLVSFKEGSVVSRVSKHWSHCSCCPRRKGSVARVLPPALSSPWVSGPVHFILSSAHLVCRVLPLCRKEKQVWKEVYLSWCKRARS